jgi:hypothetical protein
LEGVHSESALELSQNFGKLPLILVHMANVIKRKQLSVGDFASLWRESEHNKYASKHERFDILFSGIWSVIFNTLSPDAKQLLACLLYMWLDTTRISLVQSVFEKTLALEDLDVVDQRLRAVTE